MRRTLVAALFVAAVALAYSADMPSSAPAPAVPGTGFYIDVNPKIGGHLFSWFFPSQDNSLGDDTPFIRSLARWKFCPERISGHVLTRCCGFGLEM